MQDIFKRAAGQAYEAFANFVYGSPYERALQQLERERVRILGEGGHPASNTFFKYLESRAISLASAPEPSGRK